MWIITWPGLLKKLTKRFLHVDCRQFYFVFIMCVYEHKGVALVKWAFNIEGTVNN